MSVLTLYLWVLAGLYAFWMGLAWLIVQVAP